MPIYSNFNRLFSLGKAPLVYPDAGGVFQHGDIADIVVESAKLNGVDPQAWLTDVLGRIAEHKITKLDELMQWRYAEASA
jgi:transposase